MGKAKKKKTKEKKENHIEKSEPLILLAEKERSLFAHAMKTSAVEVKPVKFQKTKDHDAEVNLLFLSELSTASSLTTHPQGQEPIAGEICCCSP